MTTVADTAISIDTFDDILAALARNPSLADRMRQHILTQELQALPAAFARMQDDIVDIKALLSRMMERQERTEADVVDIKALLARMMERQERTEADVVDIKALLGRMTERQERAEADIVELKSDVTDLKAGQARLETDVTDLKAGQARAEADIVDLKTGQSRLETDVADLKAGQSRLETDVADLKAGQSRLETDVADLKVGQARLETDFAELKESQNQTNSRLGNLTGTVYEQRIVKRFRSIARRHLDIRGAQVLQAVNHPYDPDLKTAIDSAEEQNRIDYDAMEALDQADVIAAGQRRNGASVFVVVEISETADDDDIDRVQERAAILQRATNQTAVAAVIGKEMSATNRQRAARREVTVIILGDR